MESARVPHSHISPLKASPTTQAPLGEPAENPSFPGVIAGSQPSGAEGGPSQPGAHPFLVGLGQTFPGVPFPPHLPYYLDPSILQQIRAGATVPVTSTADTTPTSRTEPVTVQSRGCSPIAFPDEAPVVTPVSVQPVKMVTTAVGTTQVLSCTVGSQTSPSPVRELFRVYPKERATQTSDVEDSAPRRVEVGVQLTPPADSDSDSNCALTMPHLTARTIDCGTQADGGSTYSSHCISSSRYYDSDRRSVSPPPPALVAEGSPRHQADTPPRLDDDQYGSDHDNLGSSMAALSSVTSSCHTTPTHSVPRGKGIFDLGIDFLNRQILEASDGLEMLSTLAERARTEQEVNNGMSNEMNTEVNNASRGEQHNEQLMLSTDTDDEATETDINKNYNAPKANMFMATPSMYSFSSTFGSPSSKKDSYGCMASTFSYTGSFSLFLLFTYFELFMFTFSSELSFVQI